jgi:hypothetical protein
METSPDIRLTDSEHPYLWTSCISGCTKKIQGDAERDALLEM